MFTFKDKLIQFGYKFTFFSMLWYVFTMKLSKKLGSQVKKYNSVEEIPKAFEFGRKYRYDQLLGSKSDHLTHPTRLQWRINTEREFGDCDDHAIYWCTALLRSKLASKVWFAFYSMKEEDQETGEIKRNGHAVCVFADLEGQLWWCDYRKPKKINEMRDFMVESASGYGRIPIAGAVWHVKGLKDDDTPIFGKRSRIL